MIPRGVTYPLRRKASLLPGVAPERVARELVPELDEHVGALSVLFHQYLKHSWVAGGEYGELATRHQAEVLGDLNAAAEATLLLGGVPLGSPLEHVNRSYLEHEDEGIFELDAMVSLDAAHEEMLKVRLGITLEAAFELSALAIQNTLSALLTHAGARRGRVERFLEGKGR